MASAAAPRRVRQLVCEIIDEDSYPERSERARRHDEVEPQRRDNLKAIDVPTLVLHGEDDQVVPFATTGKMSAEIVEGAKRISYPGFPRGMPVTNAERINADMLAFIEG